MATCSSNPLQTNWIDVEQHLVEVVARADTLVHILQQHMWDTCHQLIVRSILYQGLIVRHINKKFRTKTSLLRNWLLSKVGDYQYIPESRTSSAVLLLPKQRSQLDGDPGGCGPGGSGGKVGVSLFKVCCRASCPGWEGAWVNLNTGENLGKALFKLWIQSKFNFGQNVFDLFKLQNVQTPSSKRCKNSMTFEFLFFQDISRFQMMMSHQVRGAGARHLAAHEIPAPVFFLVKENP